MNRGNKILPYNICSGIVLSVFVLQFFVSFFIKFICVSLGVQTPHDFLYIILTQLFAVGLPCTAIVLNRKVNLQRTFAVRKPTLLKSFYAIVLGISVQPVAMLVNVPLQRLAYKFGDVPKTLTDPPETTLQILLMILVICALPAFFEEFLLRGAVLTSLKRYGIRTTILITSVLFVLLHNDYTSAPGLFILGIVLSYSVLMTGTVWTGVLMHFSFNTSGVLTDYFVNKYYQINNFGFFGMMAAVGLTAAIFAIFGLYDKTKSEFYEENMTYKPMLNFLNIPVMLIVIGYIINIIV